MRSVDECDEELRSIGIWTGISHGEKVRLFVLSDEVFIRELFTVDGLPASPVSFSEVTALGHETRDHSVEFGASIAKAFLASAERAEVLRSPGDYIVVEFEINSAPILFCSILGCVFYVEINVGHCFAFGVDEARIS